MNNTIKKKSDIFTPDDISKLMQQKLKNYGSILEPSVGIGNLINNINISNYERIDVYDINKDYLDKIILNVSKHHKDFLKENINTKYDNIILNPPYIKIQEIDICYRDYLKSKFVLLKNGSFDIYYAFLLKCLDLLKDDGIMIALIPNTYLYNKSAYNLRKYLIDNKFIESIIDYKDKKIFGNVSVYCCITIFTKTNKDTINYNNNLITYENINNYSLFNDKKDDGKLLKNICNITNGIATLRDKIYIHPVKLYNESCWKTITNGREIKYIIYPYENGIIIPENKFKQNNPKTFEFLQKNKSELEKRDKGKVKYETWYAFGRKQSLKIKHKKCIYIPTFLHPSKISESMHINENMLHYGCLCIEPNDNISLDDIKIHLINNIDYITNSSSVKSGGWINLSSSILKNIKI
jgi:hypothetical protein